MEETRKLLNQVLTIFRDREASHAREVDEFKELLGSLFKHHETEIKELHALLEDSEKRIKTTNEMVLGLTRTIDSIKDAYIHHIDQAVNSRNTVISQNQLLLDRMSAAESSIKEERDRYDRLMKSLLDILGKQGTSVNIKQ